MNHFLGILLAMYFFLFLVLSLFGLHRYLLVLGYYRGRRRQTRPGTLDPLPSVTVQLPIYNEVYVVERLIEAVCRMDYPRDRIQVQILDDSTDETQHMACAAAKRFRREGLDIVYIHRSSRQGFKAGALQNGLRSARGEFVAVFDADFLPQPSFLRDTIHYFCDKRVGMVQARWDYLNRNYSLLTRVQALFLDGHFVVEHSARQAFGCFFNFNGTAGLWRKRCIEDAGAWEQDTLTEDLDLSYRAQLKGWRFVYLPDVSVPSEIPVDMNAFKSQQHRWAKGSIQTARKLLRRILKAPLPVKVKLEAIAHLTSNFAFLCMALLAVILYPAILARFHLGWPRFWITLSDAVVFLTATLSVSAFYIESQRGVRQGILKTLFLLPMLMSVGIGISLNNAKGVLEALLGYGSPFERTPKYRMERNCRDWKQKKYRAKQNLVPYLELFLGLYFTAVMVFAVQRGLFLTMPFLFLFQFGFLYTAFLSLGQRGLPTTLLHASGPGTPRVQGRVRSGSRSSETLRT